MRTLLKSALMTALLALATNAMALTIGTVNVQKALLAVKDGQKAQTQLQGIVKKEQEGLKKEEEKFTQAREAFEKQALVMNAQAKSKKEKELQEQFMKLQSRSMELQKEISKKENDLKQPILDRMKGLIEDLSKKADVDLTFEESTTPILFSKSSKDLTDDLIAAYDKKYPSK